MARLLNLTKREKTDIYIDVCTIIDRGAVEKIPGGGETNPYTERVSTEPCLVEHVVIDEFRKEVYKNIRVEQITLRLFMSSAANIDTTMRVTTVTGHGAQIFEVVFVDVIDGAALPKEFLFMDEIQKHTEVLLAEVGER